MIATPIWTVSAMSSVRIRVFFNPVLLPFFLPDIKSENFCMKAWILNPLPNYAKKSHEFAIFLPDSKRERLVVSGQLWWVVAPVPALRSSEFFWGVTKNLLVFDTKLVLNHFCQCLSIWLTRGRKHDLRKCFTILWSSQRCFWRTSANQDPIDPCSCPKTLPLKEVDSFAILKSWEKYQEVQLMVQVVEDLLVDKHVSSDFRSRNRRTNKNHLLGCHGS